MNPSTWMWDVWCKPVELTWFTWLLPLNLMEAQKVQACLDEDAEAGTSPAPLRAAFHARPHIYLVGGTDVTQPR